MAAFMQLATKFLQLNPTGTIPVTPPSTEFAGDTITVSYGDPASGLLVFEASAANAVGVTTELLIQRVANAHRTPSAEAYKHAAWKAFTSGSLSEAITLPVGFYAAAYRFVKNSTGQMTDLVVLPVENITFAVRNHVTQPASSLRKLLSHRPGRGCPFHFELSAHNPSGGNPRTFDPKRRPSTSERR